MNRIMIIILGLAIILTACGSSGSTDVSESNSSTTAQEKIPTLTIQPLATSTEASTQSQNQPNELPSERVGRVGDHDSSETAGRKHPPGGDRFTFGKFERPFNADTMEQYFPEIDIIDTFVFQDDDWVYGVIKLKDFDSQGNLPGKYGVEFDLDLNGKGDVLVLVSQPASSNWSTEGVQVFQDSNQNVGGSKAVVSDYDTPGDGYEDLIFDEGTGDDPDLAWTRVTSGSVFLEIAIKRSALGEEGKFMLNMWAGTDDLNPSQFDINDLLTHEQAGAADPGFEYFYPIKGLSEIDNTCRLAVGFEPTGLEHGLCDIFRPKPEGGDSCKPPPGGCPGGYIFENCNCVRIN